MGDIQHRRRPLRRWLCVCGRRFPCGSYLARRDEAYRTQDGEKRGSQRLVGWNFQGGWR